MLNFKWKWEEFYGIKGKEKASNVALIQDYTTLIQDSFEPQNQAKNPYIFLHSPLLLGPESTIEQKYTDKNKCCFEKSRPSFFFLVPPVWIIGIKTANKFSAHVTVFV